MSIYLSRVYGRSVPNDLLEGTKVCALAGRKYNVAIAMLSVQFGAASAITGWPDAWSWATSRA
jgi:hypothetical protein